MSFLLNLVPSCGNFGHKLPPNSPTEEETTSLMKGSGKAKKGHQAKNSGGPRKTTAPPLQWRPSLCTITEDDVVKEAGNKVMRRNIASKQNYLGYKNDLRQQNLPYVSQTTLVLINGFFLFDFPVSY